MFENSLLIGKFQKAIIAVRLPDARVVDATERQLGVEEVQDAVVGNGTA